MEKRLALLAAAGIVFRTAILLNLRGVATNRFPAFDLPRIFLRQPPTPVVAAVPLKPSARVVLLADPSFLLPHRERLTRIDAKVIDLGVVLVAARLLKLRAAKPALRKLLPTVAHVHAAKHTECEHLLWGEIGFKLRIKVPPRRLRERV